MAGRLIIVFFVLIGLTAMTAASQQQPPPPVRDAPSVATGSSSGQPALPPLSADAQQLLDQWKQTPASTIEQLRYLQLTYRDAERAEGAVWGSGAYTDDSTIAAAAVHAGLLKPGELGFVRVSVEAGRDSDDGSERNGIKSSPFGTFDGTFRLGRVAR